MNDPLAQLGLADLVHPLLPEQFLRRHWDQKIFASALEPAVFALLCQELYHLDPYQMIHNHGGPGTAQYYIDRSRYALWYPPHDQWSVLYDAGHTIFMNELGNPAIDGVASRIAATVGHPASRVTTGSFLVRDGGGSRVHFDSLNVFTMQLAGTKRWRMVTDTTTFPTLVNPTENGTVHKPFSDELLCSAPFAQPTADPTEYEDVVLRPGDVLYIPRGMWHEVEATGDCISLFIGFETAPWLELVVEALRNTLLRDARWRACMVAAEGPHRSRAHQQLETLLADLPRQIAHLDAESVLSAHQGRPPAEVGAKTRLRRNPLASLAVQREGEGLAIHVRRHLGSLGGGETFVVDPAFERVCRELALAGDAPFSATTLRVNDDGVDLDSMVELLSVLLEAGYLLPTAASGDAQAA